ncbi:S46 family peptidase [Bacteroidales bacterium OttesenSCG-928-M11]|nr:S46 family peptidase [Bacteroidales bacterium OttesenSCG-928-M11]
MKRIFTYIMALFCCLPLIADEGMWIPKTLSGTSFQKMQDLGLLMTFEELYDEDNLSLKDAIVQLSIGCTGVTVSKDGLFFTNHHCGYGAIQKLSSVDHDYLRDGFVSHSFEEELPAEGMWIRYLIRSEDCTNIILEGINEKMSEGDRIKAINEKIDALEKELSKQNPGSDIEINAYYANNKFFVNTYKKFSDIRLVFAPPSSIGKFGAESDNWMWPRQTGDFSVFRIYANQDNEPAAYSPDNIPYNPPYVAPISLDGYENGSFAMIMGFPGSTNRYLSSWGVESRMNSQNKPRIEMRGAKQEIWMKAMKESDEIRIKYSSKYMGSSNYWKNSIGMNLGIEKSKVIPRKEVLEARFKGWLTSNPKMNTKYGEVLPLLKNGYTELNDYIKPMIYIQEMISGVEVIQFGSILNRFSDPATSEDFFDNNLANRFKDYESTLDEKVLAKLLEVVKENVPADILPDIYKTIDKKYKGNYEKYAADVFKKSFVPYPEKLKAAMSDKNFKKKLEKDPAFILSSSFIKTGSNLGTKAREIRNGISRGERLFMQGLMEMNPTQDYASDANFTLRLTYGTVGGYKPYDGTWYEHYTTPKGIFEKYVENDFEFHVQPEILAMFKKGDFGQYADKDGVMHVCFLSNNDITGGNSGSPIFDSKGRVIGLAFDGNWEAMSGDIAFKPDVQRTINVDIRYVLYIIEKWGKAQRLIDELTIQ